VFPKYVLVVILSGIASYGLISLLTRVFSMGVIWAKLLAEALIFTANFAVLREFIFSRRNVTERSES
jgi:hypothetical protein